MKLLLLKIERFSRFNLMTKIILIEKYNLEVLLKVLEIIILVKKKQSQK